MEHSSAPGFNCITAERVKDVRARVSVTAGKELSHLSEPHQLVEGHPAAQRDP